MAKDPEVDRFDDRLLKHLTDVLMDRAPVFADAVPDVARTCVSLMVEEFGGEQLYMRKSCSFSESRDEAIRKEFDGRNFRILARTYGLSERRVREIVASSRKGHDEGD
ncbi:MAG TPA: Mor transcription activator family protein [Rhodocyclaceae bacterium]|nr:Mor transcription activator family protein [Rhodocyclaceae bacterium]